MSTAGSDVAAASASSLAAVPAGSATQEILGLCLFTGMGEAAMVERMNTWGAIRDQALLDLRSDLVATQVAVSTTFDQAKETLLGIVVNFRIEAEALRQHGQYEATQSVARLEQVVAEARTRFDAQDARFTENLGELVRRQQSVEDWARAEPARVAAIVQAAPAPSWVTTSPGGTLTFYPSAGLPAAPTTPPPRAAVAPVWAPVWDASPSPQAPGATPAWDAWAAGRGAAPAPDAWAAGRAAQGPPAAPRPFDMGPPGDGGGSGGGKGAYPYPREMRIDARSWGDHRKLDVGTSFEGFQVWKDRAMMFLSRERPDVRRLLTWAEAQSKDSLESELRTQAGSFGIADLAAVEYAIHDGIKLIILDGLLGRARNCVERGCELWRSLCAEWSGAAPQLQHAKARRYQEPTRCKDTSELWCKLPAWERLGEEVMLSDLILPEWMRSAALEKLLPAPLLQTLVARSELSTYPMRVTWVKTQMEHARGLAQATAYGPGTGKDASGDVYMNSLEAPPGLAHRGARVGAGRIAPAGRPGAGRVASGRHLRAAGQQGPELQNRALSPGQKVLRLVCSSYTIW